jgi:hypothetical protein
MEYAAPTPPFVNMVNGYFFNIRYKFQIRLTEKHWQAMAYLVMHREQNTRISQTAGKLVPQAYIPQPTSQVSEFATSNWRKGAGLQERTTAHALKTEMSPHQTHI